MVSIANESCVFCKIVRKEKPANFVYEDERVMAFLDIMPVSDGHTLVIPKTHYATIYDVPDDEVAYLYTIVKRVALAVKKGVAADGIRITQRNETAAGQIVFHVHVHVIPMYLGQKLRRFGEAPEASTERLDKVAVRIRKYIKSAGSS